MKQGIEKIIEIITVTVHPNNAASLDLAEQGSKTILHTASTAKEFIKKHLIGYLINPCKKNKFESLIQNYQSLIIKSLDDLFTYQHQTQNLELIDLYSSLINSIADLLTYIETYFYTDLNIGAKIPKTYYSSQTEEFKQQLSKLRILFEGKSEDLQLIEIIVSHYGLTEQGLNTGAFTYRDLIYRKELFRELNSVHSNTSIFKCVKDVLVYLNFNHIQFFKYLIDKLEDECKRLEDPLAKLELLKFHRKQFRQTVDQEKFALFCNLTSIKDQVLLWIEEEIFFMEGQIKAVEQWPEENAERLSEAKITVALSVAQLGVLIRVFTLGKVITNNNQLEVIKTFAASFKTHRAEDISYGSLYGKYYKPEASAIRAVRGILLELVSVTTKMNG